MTAARRALARLRALAQGLLDNPSAELDLRAILVGPKLGGLLAFETGLLAVVAIGTSGEGLQQAAAAAGPGELQMAALLLTLTLVLTAVLPIRAAGLLEGPRWRGYLDQVVTTGVHPLRYFAGKWAVNQGLLLALLAASLPIVALVGLLSGVAWPRVAGTYALLYAYGNLLLAVTFAAGVVLHEVAAALTVTLGFISLNLLQLLPIPSTVAAWTPSRWIVAPCAGPLAGSSADVAERLYGAATPFGLTVPWPVWALGLWALLGALALITCALGPLHTFVPALNNFGLVVLPGDQKKARFRRFRPLLSRRIELAFLFENRGPWLVRWTVPLRTLQQWVLLSLLATLTVAALFDGDVIRELLLSELRLAHGAAMAALLALALCVFCSGRVRALQQVAVGPWRLPQLAWDASGFVLFLGALVLLHALAFTLAWDQVALARTAPWEFLSRQQLFASSSRVLAVLVTTAVSFFLILRVVGSEAVGQARTFGIGAVVAAAFVVLAPAIPLVGASFIMLNELRGLEHVVESLLVVSQLSPVAPLAWELGMSVAQPVGFLARQGFWVLHPALILYLLGLTWTTQRAVRDEAAVHEAQGRGEAQAGVRGEPCAACDGVLSVPLGLTWWGGALAPRALGYLRCLDCRGTHLARTGRPAPLLVARVLGLRLAAGAALVAIAWVVWTQGGGW